jgi:HAE1 family hydrophobic/amphiphilic exporter-1
MLLRPASSLGPCAALCFTLAFATAADAQENLTIGDAITRALAKNRDIAIERENVQQADASIERARAAWDPTVRVDARYRDQQVPVTSILSGAPAGELAPTFREIASTASYSQLLASGASITFSTSIARDSSNNILTLISPGWFTTFGAEIRQPLLQNRRIDPARRAIRIATVSRDRNLASLRRTVAETTAAVEQAYWTLVSTDQEVEVRRASIALAERQRDDVSARIEGKVTPESDIAQPNAEIARRRGDLLAAIEARARAERSLKVLMLESAADPAWDVTFRPIDAPAPAVAAIDVQEALRSAAKERPELADVDTRLALQDVELDAARDRLRPQLDLVGAYTTRGLAGARNPGVQPFPGLPQTFPDQLQGGIGDSLDSALRHRFPDATVAVQLTIPLGHRAARADVASAQSVKRQTVDARERLLLLIGLEVRNAVTAIDTAAARMDAARAARDAAEVQLQAEQDRFTAGLTTTFLVLTRQNDLATARLGETSALAAWRRALVELSRAKGTILAERNIDWTVTP